MMPPIKTYEIDLGEVKPSIRCLRCDHRSYNRNDIEQRYCSFCHVFHEASALPADQRTPGATGRDAGQLGPHDQGQLRCALTVERGFIVMHFGKAVTWVSIDPAEARGLARVLLQKADEIERRT